MKIICKFAIALAIVYSSNGLAANEGEILRLGFSGSNSTWGAGHSDVVQLTIEGGYDYTGCHSTYAAIRKSDSHLVSAALAAFTAGKQVMVRLSTEDKYYSDRCVITDLFLNN